MYYNRQNSILEEIRETFKHGNMLTKLIYINLGVFLLVFVSYALYFLFANPIGYLSKHDAFEFKYLDYLKLSTVPGEILYRPWTPITYMFLHFSFIHILFNLIGLYLFGRIYLQYLNNKQMLTTYLLGGLSGGLVYVLSYNLFPGLKDTHGVVLGASGAIMAIAIAICFYHPDFAVYIPVFGQVRLKYIGLFYVIIDIVLIGSDNNVGGHITHLGGALYGYLFAIQLKKGRDLGNGFSNVMDSLVTVFKSKPKMKVTYRSKAKSMDDFEYNKNKADYQKEIDAILDKIAKSGYDSLSKKEKEILFKMGKDK